MRFDLFGSRTLPIFLLCALLIAPPLLPTVSPDLPLEPLAEGEAGEEESGGVLVLQLDPGVPSRPSAPGPSTRAGRGWLALHACLVDVVILSKHLHFQDSLGAA